MTTATADPAAQTATNTPTIPGPDPRYPLTANIKLGDTVVFRRQGSAAEVLLMVKEIIATPQGRGFVSGPHRISGKIVRCLESQVHRVITRSVDDDHLFAPNRKDGITGTQNTDA